MDANARGGLTLCLVALALLVTACGESSDDGLAGQPLVSGSEQASASSELPNLTIDAFSAPSAVPAGSAIQATATIANQGPVAAGAVGYTLHLIVNGEHRDHVTGVLAGLDAGAQQQVSVSVTVDAAAGDEVVLCFEVDEDEDVEESDQDDNRADQDVTVTPPSGNG